MEKGTKILPDLDYNETSVAAQPFTPGAVLLAFLIVSILVSLKKEDKQFGGWADISLKENAKLLYDGLNFYVPSNTLIVYPLSVNSNKSPPKGNENQDEVRVVLLSIILSYIITYLEYRNYSSSSC